MPCTILSCLYFMIYLYFCSIFSLLSIWGKNGQESCPFQWNSWIPPRISEGVKYWPFHGGTVAILHCHHSCCCQWQQHQCMACCVVVVVEQGMWHVMVGTTSVLGSTNVVNIYKTRQPATSEKTSACGSREMHDAWTEQVCELHLNNTHTHTHTHTLKP